MCGPLSMRRSGFDGDALAAGPPPALEAGGDAGGGADGESECVEFSGALRCFRDGSGGKPKLLWWVLRDVFMFALGGASCEQECEEAGVMHPEAVVFLDGCRAEAVPEADADASFPNAFSVSHLRRRNWCFSCETPELRDRWLRALGVATSGREVANLVQRLDGDAALAFQTPQGAAYDAALSAAHLDSGGESGGSDSDGGGWLEEVEDLKRRPFDKAYIFQRLSAMDEEARALAESGDDPEAAERDRTLRAHRSILAKEVRSLRSQLGVHERAAEQVAAELERVRADAVRDERFAQHWTNRLLGLNTRFVAADPDQRSEKYINYRRPRGTSASVSAAGAEGGGGGGGVPLPAAPTPSAGGASPAAAAPAAHRRRESSALAGAKDELEVLALSGRMLAAVAQDAQSFREELAGAGEGALRACFLQALDAFLANTELRLDLNTKYHHIYVMTVQEARSAFEEAQKR